MEEIERELADDVEEEDDEPIDAGVEPSGYQLLVRGLEALVRWGPWFLGLLFAVAVVLRLLGWLG